MTSKSDLEKLIGQYVFAEYTYGGHTTIVKGLVLEIGRGRLKLELTGNGRRFDGKKITSIVPELQTVNGEIRTAGAHGDLPDLGVWQ